MKNIVFFISLILGLYSFSAYAAPLSLEVRKSSTAETLVISAPNAGKSKIFMLDNPPRLVIDLPSSTRTPLTIPKTYAGTLLKGVRVGQFDTKTVRIVFALSQQIDGLGSQGSGNTLTVTLPYADDKKNRSEIKNLADSVKPSRKTPVAAGSAPKEESHSAPAIPKHKERTKQTVKEDISQPPNKIPVVVIDAGHGGQDPGAKGQSGSFEKDIVLSYALGLQKALNATGRYKAVLTRDNDTFILLRERTAIAHRARGNLFISLHADSAPGVEARGLSIYTLSETASDAETAALAANENRADILSGMDLSGQSEDVAGILISLAQRETNTTSALFADLLVRALDKGGVRLLEHSHRFAGFAVLKSPDMPSVLVETGFISHPEEEQLLKSARYRNEVIDGLVQGIDTFFARQKALSKEQRS